MQRSCKVKVLELWGLLSQWVKLHQPAARLISLMLGLVVFFVFLPPYMRFVIWHGLRSHKILAGMLVVFSLLGISLVWSTGQHLDAWAFLLFNVRGTRPLWLDRVMLGFTQVGSGFAAMGVALVMFLTGSRHLSYALILGTLTLWLVVELVKFLVHRSRPFIRLSQARVVGYRVVGRSFPSGHTSQTFFMVTLIAQHFHAAAWLVLLLYAAAFLVGVTRIYIGAHYPRDVLAGALLGSAWGILGVIVDGFVLNWTG